MRSFPTYLLILFFIKILKTIIIYMYNLLESFTTLPRGVFDE